MDPKRTVFHFYVILKWVEPTVWRRILVSDDATFWDLHVALQNAMGWEDEHLHVFRAPHPQTGDAQEIGIPTQDLFGDEKPCQAGWEVPLRESFRQPGDRVEYDYDFGDGWEHEVVLEAISEVAPRTRLPRCLDGAGACPPEDCGGVGGYEELLDVLRDPTHEEHESMLEWLGGPFDPTAFDPKKVRFDNPRILLLRMMRDMGS